MYVRTVTEDFIVFMKNEEFDGNNWRGMDWEERGREKGRIEKPKFFLISETFQEYPGEMTAFFSFMTIYRQ